MVDTLDLLRRNPVQVVAIGIVLAIVIGVFAYAAGYLTPHRLSGARTDKVAARRDDCDAG
jgi:hypothetical protein